MSDNTFVDTNVLVYARDASEPEKQQAAIMWLQDIWHNRTGRISTQVCNEYYVTVTQKLEPGLSRKEAWEDICALESWRPVSIDMKCLYNAKDIQDKTEISWWDALIISAAYSAECNRIISEDLNAGQIVSGIEIVNPFQR